MVFERQTKFLYKIAHNIIFLWDFLLNCYVNNQLSDHIKIILFIRYYFLDIPDNIFGLDAPTPEPVKETENAKQSKPSSKPAKTIKRTKIGRRIMKSDQLRFASL